MVPALRKLRQGDFEFESTLSYMVRHYLLKARVGVDYSNLDS